MHSAGQERWEALGVTNEPPKKVEGGLVPVHLSDKKGALNFHTTSPACKIVRLYKRVKPVLDVVQHFGKLGQPFTRVVK